MLNENQQILEQINRAKEILITFKKNFSGDSIASALALQKTLKKMDKRVNITASNFSLPKQYNFLPNHQDIKSELYHLKKFTISVDTSQAPIEELSYDKEGEELKIYLMPKTGSYSKADLGFVSSDYRYDLIFVIDSPDLESLGVLYEKNAEFFYQTPIINIDHSPANEYFGQINKVDLTATATSEIIYSLIVVLGEDLIDENIATCIYTGMTDKTRSFKSQNITPETLNIASKLIQLGADREKIVTCLYRTKSIQTLKLWGRALTRIQLDPKLKLVWATLSLADFDKAGANINNLNGLIDEIIMETPQAETIVLFLETGDQTITTRVYTTHRVNALGITKTFSPNGNKQYSSFSIKDKRLAEAEREIIEAIKTELEKII